MNMRQDLYCKDAKGQIRIWSIWNIDDAIYMEYGLVGGQIISDSEIVPAGLAGRTTEEQIGLRINSRVNKKIDAGYSYNIEDAKNNKRTNKLGFSKPMLAYRFDKIKNFNPVQTYVQEKFDGHRCLITNQGGQVIAYSRNGKIIDSIDHILNHVKIPDGTTIDGELYHHTTPLQTITSWVKKKQDNTELLKFICYDVIDSACYSKRSAFIKTLDLGEGAIIAPTALFIGAFDPIPLMIGARCRGYEGLILRPIGFPYEDGKRSKGLIKVKEWLDDEYKVIKISKSVDGHAILHLQHNGKPFTVTSPGAHLFKIEVANSPERWIQKMVNVQYANLTKDGVPFHPVATMWREKDAE